MVISSATHPWLSLKLTEEADRDERDEAPDLRIDKMPIDPLTPTKNKAVYIGDGPDLLGLKEE